MNTTRARIPLTKQTTTTTTNGTHRFVCPAHDINITQARAYLVRPISLSLSEAATMSPSSYFIAHPKSEHRTEVIGAIKATNILPERMYNGFSAGTPPKTARHDGTAWVLIRDVSSEISVVVLACVCGHRCRRFRTNALM